MPDFDISVVTPSLNQGEYLEQCITSVLEQQDVSVQYIVVDGLSDDQTPRVLDTYRNRIDTLIVEKDSGQADALAKGFALAKAEFVCYLNSDDYLFPGALKRAIDALRSRRDVDLVYSHRTYVDAEDRFLRYWNLPRHCNYIHLRWDFIPQETCVWRRKAMDSVGGIDRTYNFAMDYDLFARMMRAGQRFIRLPLFLAAFREHARSKTTRLMDSLGASEVQRVQKSQNIAVHPWDRLVIAAWFARLQARSSRHKSRFPDGPNEYLGRATPKR